MSNPVERSSSGEIKRWTHLFAEMADADAIFSAFRSAVPERNPKVSQAVGALWYHLSEAIVDVLCLALGQLRSPAIRHFVVQTAYEELGEADDSAIHTDLMIETLGVVGVSRMDVLRFSGHPGVSTEIDGLLDALRDCRTDAEIAGLLLGLEIIAYENIANVIDYIDHAEVDSGALRSTRWVRIHDQVEDEHIRRAVGVFVRHVRGNRDQRDFIARFQETMRFWRRFWGQIAQAATAV